MVRVPYLIGSYNKNNNQYVIFDRKIASSLITLFYHDPIEIYKKESEYTLTKRNINLDIEKTKINILIRNPISRTKSYISETIFKQLHHFINKDVEIKDGYDFSLFENKKILDLFKNISNFVYLKNEKYYFNNQLLSSDFVDDFVELIINYLLDFIKSNRTATLGNNYNEKIYNLINTLDYRYLLVIDTTNISNHFGELGIYTKDLKYNQSELHRNHSWSEMIKPLYPHIKSHPKWFEIYNFFEKEIYYYKNILKINNTLKKSNLNKTIL